MSVAMPSHRIGSEPFALLARIFNGLKRRGRVIDVMYFQQSPEYARAVLALADECDDDAVREMGASLRVMLGAWIAPPVVVAIPEPPATKTGRVPAIALKTGRTQAIALPAETPAAQEEDPVAALAAAEMENAERVKDVAQEIESKYVGRLR